MGTSLPYSSAPASVGLTLRVVRLSSRDPSRSSSRRRVRLSADGVSVTVLERWRDKASLNAYLARSEVVAIFTRWIGRMRNEVKMYDASNERSPRD